MSRHDPNPVMLFKPYLCRPHWLARLHLTLCHHKLLEIQLSPSASIITLDRLSFFLLWSFLDSCVCVYFTGFPSIFLVIYSLRISSTLIVLTQTDRWWLLHKLPQCDSVLNCGLTYPFGHSNLDVPRVPPTHCAQKWVHFFSRTQKSPVQAFGQHHPCSHANQKPESKRGLLIPDNSTSSYFFLNVSLRKREHMLAGGRRGRGRGREREA